MKYSLGRYVYGLAAIGFGICALAFHDVSNWLQPKALADVAHNAIYADGIGVIQILGGAAVLWSRTARTGALVLGVLYLVFSLTLIPYIAGHPLVFAGYGNFGELFASVAGAMILYARTERMARIGYYAFALCVVSFGLYQIFGFSDTASLVPKWIPPGQAFWAVATTIAFLLAAIAMLTGWWALLAARLNTAMLVGFGLLVWVPALLAQPRSFGDWTEFLQTLGIAASSWIVTDYLGQRGSRSG